MSPRDAWSERSNSAKRKLFAQFAIVYLVVALLGLAFGWMAVGLIFGLGALGLGVAWSMTPADDAEPAAPREKPDWMKAMDDPNAPDHSLPEYRTAPPSAVRDDEDRDDSSGNGGDQPPIIPPEVPPSPTA